MTPRTANEKSYSGRIVSRSLFRSRRVSSPSTPERTRVRCASLDTQQLLRSCGVVSCRVDWAPRRINEPFRMASVGGASTMPGPTVGLYAWRTGVLPIYLNTCDDLRDVQVYVAALSTRPRADNGADNGSWRFALARCLTDRNRRRASCNQIVGCLAARTRIFSRVAPVARRRLISPK